MSTNSGNARPPKPMRTHPNKIHEYTRSIFKSERARVDGTLAEDFSAVMEGHALYLESMLCRPDDFNILRQLMTEMAAEEERNPENTGMINWSKHYKYENPDFSPTFQKILAYLADYFDVEIHATRLNFYPDSTSWKPFHHDSHAYGAKGIKEDFTMGASFGESRELAFLHPQSNNQFVFPQHNGDVFAFDSLVNNKFQHGVPKVNNPATGPRFSIIAWGRRRTINERNGGVIGEVRDNSMQARDEAVHVYDDGYANSNKPGEKENSKGPDMKEVVASVEAFIAARMQNRMLAQAGDQAKGIGSNLGRAASRGGRIQGGAFRGVSGARGGATGSRGGSSRGGASH